MVANGLGHMELQVTRVEVDGALQVAHFEVRVADFGFVICCHYILTCVQMEWGNGSCRLLYHPVKSPLIEEIDRVVFEIVYRAAGTSS